MAGFDSKSSSDILIRIAPYLGKFIARIFQIETEYQELRKRVLSDGRIFDWKKKFLDKHVLKHHPSAEEMEQWDLSELEFGYRALADRYLSQEQLAEDPEKELAEAGLSVLEAVEKAKAENSQDLLSAALHDLAIVQKCQRHWRFIRLKNRSVGFSLLRRLKLWITSGWSISSDLMRSCPKGSGAGRKRVGSVMASS
jgi:hypothetical protein